MTKVSLISTGGTIAKKYDELSGDLIFDKEHIEKMLSQGRCKLPIDILPLMLKDSLDMNERDRELLLHSCQKELNSNVVITHGTDTMVESAKVLSTIKDKTIVLTGAMIPYAFKNSDAVFNLSFALSSVQTLDFGVYICMNGQIFLYDDVQKNKNEGYFEKLS